MSAKTGITDNMLLRSGYRCLKVVIAVSRMVIAFSKMVIASSKVVTAIPKVVITGFLWFRKWLLMVFVVPKMVISGFCGSEKGY